jgi:maltose alpha-D-glucosyltransferase / alpha-amylase
MRTLTRRTFQLLRRHTPRLEESERLGAEHLATQEQELLERFRELTGGRISAVRIRSHGDYHLGQVLYTGRDFVIIDFEGEPARPLTERRLKRSALSDVAGMLRSFSYAVQMALAAHADAAAAPTGRAPLDAWADAWEREMRELFLRGYLEEVGEAAFVPRDRDQLDRVLAVFELEKAVYELGYELNNRPDWIWLPTRGILKILGETV